MTVTVVRSVRATGKERGATRASRLIMDQHVRRTVCQCWTNTTALVTVRMSLQFSKLNFLNFLINKSVCHHVTETAQTLNHTFLQVQRFV